MEFASYNQVEAVYVSFSLVYRRLSRTFTDVVMRKPFMHVSLFFKNNNDMEFYYLW